MSSLAAEDYLAEIFRLQAGGEAATTGSVADRRHVRPASTTSMFKRLARDGLVTYKEYEGVTLTEEGQRVALGVLRRHRLVERFLTDVLRMPWESVDDLADEMEHALPDAVLDALERLLGNPLQCPHGYPIPDREGHLPPIALRRLSDLRAGDCARVSLVDERVPGLLSYLNEIGMTLDAEVRVEALNAVDETMTVSVAGAVRVVGPRVTQSVSVSPPQPYARPRGGRARQDAAGPARPAAGRIV